MNMTPCWSQENVINAAGESLKRIGDQSGLILLRLDVNKPVADLRRGREGRPPWVQILSISCSFWENLAKSYVGAPPPGSWCPLLGEILDPPL